MATRSQNVQRFVVGTLAVLGFVAGLLTSVYLIHQVFTDPEGLPSLWVLVPDLGRYLAWPAFAGLGILIIWLSPTQSGALFGVLFLSVYTWWGVAIGNLPSDHGLYWPLTMVVDFLFHTSAIRFSQLFPRPLHEPVINMVLQKAHSINGCFWIKPNSDHQALLLNG